MFIYLNNRKEGRNKYNSYGSCVGLWKIAYWSILRLDDDHNYSNHKCRMVVGSKDGLKHNYNNNNEDNCN